jgi:hypothetical protein
MIILSYLIISISLMLTVFNLKKKLITETVSGNGYRGFKPWCDTFEFWQVISMVAFPIVLPAWGLSTILIKLLNKKNKNEEN